MNKANANDKVRTLIVWEIPTVGSPAFIEMYVNPESLSIKDSKILNPQRTKGGYILQYYGEELTEISLNGNTGSGGIEALNVLRDIYRSEQISVQEIISSNGSASKRRQSLAQLASSVVMWYQGQGYRGFFTNFGMDEAVSGLIKYNMVFKAVETIGAPRKNSMPWQRKPWSTLDNPSTDGGRGIALGGAYGTNFKIGEMNAPSYDTQTGLLRDDEFASKTGELPSQSDMTENLEDNNQNLTASNLFANT